MILIFAGAIQVAIGLIFWIYPARTANGLYGYTSYLASTTAESFKLAQKWARQTLLMTGVLEIIAGLIVRQLKWENFFFIWLIVAVLLFLPVFTRTEQRLKQYLKKRGELPADYVDPDVALQARSNQRKHRP